MTRLQVEKSHIDGLILFEALKHFDSSFRPGSTPVNSRVTISLFRAIVSRSEDGGIWHI